MKAPRPTITLKQTPDIKNKVCGLYLDETPIDVVLRQDMIFIGCTNITPEAAQYVIGQYEKHFAKKNEVVI